MITNSLNIPHPIAPYPKLIINAAITGMVPTKEMTPHVPISPDEIIADAAACYAAGASIVHVHARDRDGAPTYHKEIFAEIIRGIRGECPGMIVCATTSGRLHNTFETRSEVLELEGEAKPDMASLTLGSLNFPKQASVNSPEMVINLARKMAERGIVPELEAFESGMVHTAKVLIKRDILQPPFYINLLLGSMYSAPGTLSELANMVRTVPEGMHWAGTGIGRFQQKMTYAAILMGGHVRIGLEDNIYFDAEQKTLATNQMLIERVVRFARDIGREIATPAEARATLGFGPASKRQTA